MIFKIGVLDHSYLAGSLFEGGANSGAFAQVSWLSMERPADPLGLRLAQSAGLRARIVVKHLRGAIGGSIVNYYYFERGQELALGQERDAIQAFSHQVLLVVDRHQHRHRN